MTRWLAHPGRQAGGPDQNAARAAPTETRSFTKLLVPCAPLDTRETVRAVAHTVLGTDVEMSAPLMSAGLDSLAGTALMSALAARLSVAVAATALFDHPTLASIASFLSSELDCRTASQSASKDTHPTERVQILSTSRGRSVNIAAWRCSTAGRVGSRSELRELSMRGLAANTHVPVS